MTAEPDVFQVADNVRTLRAEISARADEIEATRAVPRDLVEKLRAAGVYRRYVPRSHGGIEAWPDDGLTVIEELARADGSVGWIAAVGSEGPGFYAYLPAETYDEIYSNGPDVIHSGAINAKGRAVRVPGGYRFTGQWSFASGSAHADMIVIQSFVEPEGDASAGGPPTTVFGVVPTAELEIVDTWKVVGLKGTGSNDLVANDLFVPEERTGSFAGIPKIIRHPLDSRPLGARFGLEFAAVALGIAMGALDDIVTISHQKTPVGSQGRLDADPVLQHMVGSFATDVRMARALLHDVARTDQASVDGPPVDGDSIARRRAALARVGSVSAAVVDGCYMASGTTGLYESSPLQRRLRDVHATTQHFLLSARGAFAPAGNAVLNDSGA